MKSENHLSELGTNERSDETSARPDDTIEKVEKSSSVHFSLEDV